MTTEEKTNVMSFDEFTNVLAEALIMDPGQLSAEAHFITDLAVDSIRMVELYLRFQEMGIEIPQDAVWEIQTVGDAYKYYRDNLQK